MLSLKTASAADGRARWKCRISTVAAAAACSGGLRCRSSTATLASGKVLCGCMPSYCCRGLSWASNGVASRDTWLYCATPSCKSPSPAQQARPWETSACGGGRLATVTSPGVQGTVQPAAPCTQAIYCHQVALRSCGMHLASRPTSGMQCCKEPRVDVNECSETCVLHCGCWNVQLEHPVQHRWHGTAPRAWGRRVQGRAGTASAPANNNQLPMSNAVWCSNMWLTTQG